MGNILNSLHNASVGGQLNFVEGVQVAQLALKHRRNKNGAQRIVLFVGSPVEAEQKALVKVGKLLKKNNIAVDVVVLGDRDGNADKLRAFVDAANANDNSNLVAIPAGVVPSDVLISSPVIQGKDSGGGGGGESTGTEEAVAVVVASPSSAVSTPTSTRSWPRVTYFHGGGARATRSSGRGEGAPRRRTGPPPGGVAGRFNGGSARRVDAQDARGAAGRRRHGRGRRPIARGPGHVDEGGHRGRNCRTCSYGRRTTRRTRR